MTVGSGADWLFKVAEVSLGKITPGEAERWVAENDSKTFRPELAKQAASAFEAAYWPFSLAAAWVAFREQVRTIEAWTEHRLRGQHSSDGRLTDAARALIVKLRAGKLVANGIRPGQQRRTEISALKWMDLAWKRWASVDVFALRNNRSPEYVDVLVPSASVLKFWKPEGAAAAKVRSSIGAETDCVAQLVEMMRKMSSTPIAKDKLRPQFQIAARAFDRAYTQAVKESGAAKWGAAGRRKSPRP